MLISRNKWKIEKRKGDLFWVAARNVCSRLFCSRPHFSALSFVIFLRLRRAIAHNGPQRNETIFAGRVKFEWFPIRKRGVKSACLFSRVVGKYFVCLSLFEAYISENVAMSISWTTRDKNCFDKRAVYCRLYLFRHASTYEHFICSLKIMATLCRITALESSYNFNKNAKTFLLYLQGSVGVALKLIVSVKHFILQQTRYILKYLMFENFSCL